MRKRHPLKRMDAYVFDPAYRPGITTVAPAFASLYKQLKILTNAGYQPPVGHEKKGFFARVTSRICIISYMMLLCQARNIHLIYISVCPGGRARRIPGGQVVVNTMRPLAGQVGHCGVL